MLVIVHEKCHDYSPEVYTVDTEKLNPANPVDRQLLAAIEAGKKYCTVDVPSYWDDPDSEYKGNDPGVSEEAKLDSGPMIYLTIDFGC